MRHCALLLCWLTPIAAVGQQPVPVPKPVIRLPEVVKAAPGQLVAVRPETDARTVWWRVPAGVQFDAGDGGRKLLLVANIAGRYPLVAFVATGRDEGAFAETTLVVEGPPPAPAEDALRNDLLALAAAETGPDRGKQLKTLAALYRQAAAFCRDEQFASTRALIDAIGRAGDSLLLSPTALRGVRERVLKELHAANLPTQDVPLTRELRDKAAEVYARASQALEEGAK
ncbi:MAG: hypothetical protein ACJ8F7_12215 [Gemmataceae bacterium]